MERGVDGGKFAGHKSSPAQGATAWTRMRCSAVFGVAVGVGRVVRVRLVDLGFGWRIARMNLGIAVILDLDIGGVEIGVVVLLPGELSGWAYIHMRHTWWYPVVVLIRL